MTQKKYDYITEGLEDDRFNLKLGWFVIGLASLVFAALYIIDNFTVVDVKTELISSGGDIFIKYLFIKKLKIIYKKVKIKLISY